MNVFFNLSCEQLNWLQKAVFNIYGEKVRLARDWQDGAATVIVFENGSYIWCFPSKNPYLQGDGAVHLPKFVDRDRYYAAHAHLERAGFNPSDIVDSSDKTGVLVDGERFGHYTFLSFRIEGFGLSFEVCFEPDHDWAYIAYEEDGHKNDSKF
ncbi:MAG: hypothetical protein FWE21_01750 [Defluviitaleaceae bacterium]|nr:hypothetical protein [Defluviitaleaceae bacterium]